MLRLLGIGTVSNFVNSRSEARGDGYADTPTTYDRLPKSVFITRLWVQRFSCPQSSFVGTEVTRSP